jgi:UDP-glucose 4-epimerase
MQEGMKEKTNPLPEKGKQFQQGQEQQAVVVLITGAFGYIGCHLLHRWLFSPPALAIFKRQPRPVVVAVDDFSLDSAGASDPAAAAADNELFYRNLFSDEMEAGRLHVLRSDLSSASFGPNALSLLDRVLSSVAKDEQLEESAPLQTRQKSDDGQRLEQHGQEKDEKVLLLVYHLAAKKAIAESLSDPLGYWRINLGTTVNLLSMLEALHTSRPKLAVQLYFSSSASIYDPSFFTSSPSSPVGLTSPVGDEKEKEQELEKGYKETNPLKPLLACHAYGATKICNEALLFQFCASQKDNKDVQVPAKSWLRVTCFRYFNPVGCEPFYDAVLLRRMRLTNQNPPKQKDTLLMTAFLRHCFSSSSFSSAEPRQQLQHFWIYGRDTSRDFLSMRHLVDAHMQHVALACENGGGQKNVFEILNLGTGRATKVAQLILDPNFVEQIARRLGADSWFVDFSEGTAQAFSSSLRGSTLVFSVRTSAELRQGDDRSSLADCRLWNELSNTSSEQQLRYQQQVVPYFQATILRLLEREDKK